MDAGSGDPEEAGATDDGPSNNISANDLDEETHAKLRGDAIGDTLYSQTFVLKTLLQFSDLQWNEEVEEDLCFLWDMTVEKDVCKYLFEISFPSLACDALQKYTENRFVEIVIGILANILCGDCEKSITNEEINIVLKELETDDHLVLIQVVRFITASAHMLDSVSFVTSEVLGKLTFILYNSTNSDLLLKTLEALAKTTTDFKLDEMLIGIDVFKSSLAAYKSIVGELDDEFGLDSKEKQQACKYMLEISTNFCAYINRSNNSELASVFRNCSNIFVNEIIRILNYYSHEENLLPITDEFIFYISVLRFVLETLHVNYMSDIFLPLTKILRKWGELYDTMVELECFMFYRGTPEVLSKDLKRFSRSKSKRILDVVGESKHKFGFDLDLQVLLDKLKSSKPIKREAQESIMASAAVDIPQPQEEVSVRDEMVETAIKFLENPSVRNTPLAQKQKFLQRKGLSDKEIQIACERSGAYAHHDQQTRLPPSPPPPANLITSYNPHHGLVQLSFFDRVREIVHNIAIFSIVAYVIHRFYQKYIAPFLFGKKKSVEETIQGMDKDMKSSITEIKEELRSVKVEVDKLNQSSDKDTTRQLVELKSEVATVKGLLLGRKQFPSVANSPVVPPSIPAWQMSSVGLTEHDGDGETKEDLLEDVTSGSGSSEPDPAMKTSESSLEIIYSSKDCDSESCHSKKSHKEEADKD
ncbi:hypothetical protein NQ315_011763 [Exocentrus adspersus]|uniref:Peroxisomal membrane protein PEX14 n=1 Tax=Exocentrus adspersus TaxID=1586481 RepID=A0AAV8W1T1_9CUCU|nr:hypothetical protein NQ315_011763 [Exocentrus adspersus]